MVLTSGDESTGTVSPTLRLSDQQSYRPIKPEIDSAISYTKCSSRAVTAVFRLKNELLVGRMAPSPTWSYARLHCVGDPHCSGKPCRR